MSFIKNNVDSTSFSLRALIILFALLKGTVYFLFRPPHRAMIGMQFAVQHFTDCRFRIIPGVFAEWAIVADCRPDFFKCSDFVFAQFNFLDAHSGFIASIYAETT
jgi:hypothetical protein